MSTPAKPKHPTLAHALLAIQSQAPRILKDAVNPHFKSRYVSLEGVMDPLRPVLTENEVVVVQSVTIRDGQPALTTRLWHAPTGESIEDTMLLMLAKDDPQGQGSAITYGRRYALMSMLGLVADDDDDANGASRRPAPRAQFVERRPESTIAPTQQFQAPPAKKATKKQVDTLDGMINRLTQAGALDAVKTAQAMQQEYSTSLTAELTSEQASDMLDRLRKLEERLG